jgi:hypothetical protein
MCEGSLSTIEYRPEDCAFYNWKPTCGENVVHLGCYSEQFIHKVQKLPKWASDSDKFRRAARHLRQVGQEKVLHMLIHINEKLVTPSNSDIPSTENI